MTSPLAGVLDESLLAVAGVVSLVAVFALLEAVFVLLAAVFVLLVPLLVLLALLVLLEVEPLQETNITDINIATNNLLIILQKTIGLRIYNPRYSTGFNLTMT